ncbi:HAD family hydrolase [Alkaliphilus peptidifermentans]|uniref:phosphoserine phosphatase n=1 Tax=Alkaliphilus peptidifermentans DSM 18978 TaxID=1120976 RepID=A0A1G5HRE8_9FIRM|nr:HAD-IB family hydrolase [Alkaliphilus peptidifermentans]SCY65870.1 HAD-superfamily subfamily IB hydrolase, TIGR01490 [Alkaliphilus peptidifermentans DSM 18978]
MSNVGVFIDIDGTLYRNSLMLEHFQKLIRYEIIDPAIWHKEAKKAFHSWDQRRGDYEDYLIEVAAIYLASMKGLNRQEMDFISNQVIEMKGDRVYRYTRDQIIWHKEQGHNIFFISGSPDYLVEKMAEKYGVTDFKGTQYLIDENGMFTGEIAQMWDSSNKHSAIIEFVQQYNLSLADSYSYGDTNGDLAMLELVGNPVAINPAKELLLKIKEDKDLCKRTTIIIERKDVIYKLNSDVEILD